HRFDKPHGNADAGSLREGKISSVLGNSRRPRQLGSEPAPDPPLRLHRSSHRHTGRRIRGSADSNPHSPKLPHPHPSPGIFSPAASGNPGRHFRLRSGKTASSSRFFCTGTLRPALFSHLPGRPFPPSGSSGAGNQKTALARQKQGLTNLYGFSKIGMAIFYVNYHSIPSRRNFTMKFKMNTLEKKWVLYDVGSSAFTLLVSTIMPIYFNYLAQTAGISDVNYLAYWGYATSLSTILVAFLGPVLGTASDT